MRLRLTHALFPEGPFFWFSLRPPFYGMEIRVSREHWLSFGYVPRDLRERGW